MVRRWCAMFAILALSALPAAAVESTSTKTVLVNTDAADFTVIAAVTNQVIRVTHVDAQNLGTAAKVTVQFCDGACGSATSKIGPFELSPATASAMGGSYTFACSDTSCMWRITPGNALVAQVNTGATNNVRVHVTYQYYQR